MCPYLHFAVAEVLVSAIAKAWDDDNGLVNVLVNVIYVKKYVYVLRIYTDYSFDFDFLLFWVDCGIYGSLIIYIL